MSADGADTDFLIDHVNPTETVEADLIQALFARLIDGIEPGAGVLLLLAIKGPWFGGLCLRGVWGRGEDGLLRILLLGLELLLRGLRGELSPGVIVVVLAFNFVRRVRGPGVSRVVKVVLSLSQKCWQAEEEKAQSPHAFWGLRRQLDQSERLGGPSFSLSG